MRRRSMRNRVAAFAAVLVVLAACGKESLPKLPVAATGGDERAAAADAALSMPATPVKYVVGDLPDMPAEAPAYRLEADSPAGAREAVAEALGTAEDSVFVADEPGRPWQMSGARDMPVQSDVAAVCPPCPPDAMCAACEPTPPETVPRAPGLLGKEAAEQRAREVLAPLGVSGGRAEVYDTPVSTEVTIQPTVGGLPTLGYAHHLSLGVEGVVIGGYGYLGSPRQLGDYPLVSVADAVERLRSGFGLGPRTLSAAIEPAPADDVQEITLTGVKLGLQLVEAHLVPAFRFEVADGEGPAVVAVVDRLLADLTPEPKPEPEPAPEPDPGWSPHPDGGSSCGAASAVPSEDTGNEPLVVQVCGPSTAQVGEEVVFDVTAADPDAPIHEGQCDGTVAGFGDGPVAAVGCAPACTEPSPREPGKVAHQYRHTYEKPGTYTAHFSFHSGPCGPYESRGEGTHTVVVR